MRTAHGVPCVRVFAFAWVCLCARGFAPRDDWEVRARITRLTDSSPPPQRRGALGWAMSAPKIVNDKRTLYVGACARAPRRP